MSSFTQILIQYEPLAWGVGAAGMAVYAPFWMNFRGSLNRAVAKNVIGIEPNSLSRRQLQKQVDEYVDVRNSHFSLRDALSQAGQMIRHPVAAFMKTHRAWKDLKHQVADVGSLSLRRLLIQEYAYAIGSTGLEIGAAYLYMRLGGNFAAALAVTMPLGTIYAIVRRSQLVVYASKRIAALQTQPHREST